MFHLVQRLRRAGDVGGYGSLVGDLVVYAICWVRGGVVVCYFYGDSGFGAVVEAGVDGYFELCGEVEVAFAFEGYVSLAAAEKGASGAVVRGERGVFEEA
jgi:hypothetical protein